MPGKLKIRIRRKFGPPDNTALPHRSTCAEKNQKMVCDVVVLYLNLGLANGIRRGGVIFEVFSFLNGLVYWILVLSPLFSLGAFLF